MRMAKKAFLVVAALLFMAGLVWGEGQTSATTTGTGTTATASAGKYKEAPMLAAMVQAGTLPSLDKRLPKVPFVREAAAIGKYGGTLRTFNTNPNSWGDMQEAPDYSAFLNVNDKTGKFEGDLAQDFSQSADGKSLTIHLREGMKWSNGDPVVADDAAFMFEIQKEGKVGNWGGIGDADRFVKVDTYTFRIEWDQPNFTSLVGMTGYGASDWGGLIASNYFKKWHIKYNPDADKIAKEKGFANWYDLMGWSLPFGGITKDLDRPTTQPWVMKSFKGDLKIFERNPYYYGVDTAGNQLPYIDRIQTQIVDVQTYQLKVSAGEADVAYNATSLDNITLYKENETKGNYKVNLIPGIMNSEMSFRFNPLDPDPAKAKALSNKVFRQALSMAINRDEINKVFFQGLAIPCQATIGPDASYYKKAWGTAYAKYDLAAANKMLDGIGLDKRDKDGFRLGYDGKTMTLAIEYTSGQVDPKRLELVKEYWEKAGIRIQIVAEDRALWRERRGASQYSIDVEGGDSAIELLNYAGPGNANISVLYWQPWDAWLNAERDIAAGKAKLADFPDGKMPGKEPPQEAKDVRRAFEKRAQSLVFSKDYTETSQKAYDILADQLWIVGTVGYAPDVYIAKNTLGNVPKANRKVAEYQGSYNFYGPLLFFK